MFSKFILLIIYISLLGLIILTMMYYKHKNPVKKIKHQWMPKGLKRPITKKQFEKQLMKTLFLLSICIIITFILYFDLRSIPKQSENKECFAGKETFEKTYKKISFEINIGNGVMSFFENFILLVSNMFTLFLCIDLTILLIRRYETENP